LTRLGFLDLSGIRITILPTQIGLLTSLQYLDLENNKLSFLPSDLNSLSTLVSLSILGNNWTFLPITQLHALEERNLTTNNLLKFSPKSIETIDEFFVVHNDLYN
jgi:Leucine-rich repeat (LRR) protein